MIKIITDSSCELSVDLAKKYDVEIIPLLVNFNKKVYKDRVDITTYDFYRFLKEKKEIPTTAQITPQLFYDYFKRITDNGDEVLALIFSSGLSGTYQSAILAKEMLQEDIQKKVYLLDTRSASVGLGLVVLEIAKIIKEENDIEKVFNKARLLSKKIEHIILVDNLEMLKKGGRISSTQAIIGGMLNIKPILEIKGDGKIYQLDKVRGWKKSINRVIEVFEDRIDLNNIGKIAIGHCNNLKLANELLEMLKGRYSCKDIFIAEMGPVISTHVGLGTIGLAFQNKKERKNK